MYCTEYQNLESYYWPTVHHLGGTCRYARIRLISNYNETMEFAYNLPEMFCLLIIYLKQLLKMFKIWSLMWLGDHTLKGRSKYRLI